MLKMFRCNFKNYLFPTILVLNCRKYSSINHIKIKEVVQKCSSGQKPVFPQQTKTGVLLANIGSPRSYSHSDLKIYLDQFLKDPRVIEISRILWYPFLHLYILRMRPYKLAGHYKMIWNHEQNEAPLITFSKNQAQLLQERFHDKVYVEWANRYGHPSIPDTIKLLQNKGCNRLILLPLYPQYSAATTASACDEAFKLLHTQRHQMAVNVIPAYYNNEAYLNSIVDQTKRFLKSYTHIKFDMVLMSYHGIPLEYVQKGDPYVHHCHETTLLLGAKLKELLPSLDFYTCFQSRFGKTKEWLKPYTEDLTLELARHGVKNVLMLTPGFASDCLETLYELDIELAEKFKSLGGENFVRVPCLNDSKEGIDFLETIIRKELD